jgi:hypothetical protein
MHRTLKNVLKEGSEQRNKLGRNKYTNKQWKAQGEKERGRKRKKDRKNERRDEHGALKLLLSHL